MTSPKEIIPASQCHSWFQKDKLGGGCPSKDKLGGGCLLQAPGFDLIHEEPTKLQAHSLIPTILQLGPRPREGPAD